MTALEYVSASALSLTLAGNTGIGPFLTLFAVGVVEKYDPTLLHMEGWVEKILASWPGLVVFGALTVLEFVGKCVPVVDEVIDSALVFVQPILSVIGSSASFGLFAPGTTPDDGGGRRLAENDDAGDDDGSSGLLTFLKVMLCVFGVGLTLLVHLGKMVVRLMSEGCCTGCITVVEETWVVTSIVLCIFIVPIAIGTALLLFVAAGLGFKSWLKKRKEKKAAATAAEGTRGAGEAEEGGPARSEDEERGGEAPLTTAKDTKKEPLLP